MDAAQALRYLRKRCFGKRYCTSDDGVLPSFYEIDATYNAMFEEWSTDEYVYALPAAQVVVSNPAHVFQDVRDLGRLRAEYQQQPPPPRHSSVKDPSGGSCVDDNDYDLKHLSASHLAVVLTHPLDMLHDLVKGYFHLRSLPPLTPTEQSYCNHVEQVLLAYLIQMTLHGGDFLGDVHAFFLELILRQSDDPPTLAFTLLHNLHVAVDGNDAAQVELFFILLDMVDRLVHLSRPIGISTLPLITGTLVGMVRPSSSSRGEYLPDRLVSIPPSTLIALLQDTAGHVAVVEMLVLNLYLRHMLHAEHHQDTYGARKGKEKFGKGLPLCPVDPSSGTPAFGLDSFDTNDPSNTSTLDVLLHHFFTTPSIAVHRLVFMVLVDLAKPNVHLENGLVERLLVSSLERGLASVVASFPTVLLPGHLSAFLGRLGDGVDGGNMAVARVHEYFVQCSTLAHIVHKRRWLDVSVGSNATSGGGGQHLDPVQRAMYLIGSAVPVERFKGQRWLAELLSEPALKKSSTDDDELAARTVGVDARQPLRLQARSTFCGAVRSKSRALRLAMVQVLALVAKRRLLLSSLKGATLPAILREVHAVAKEWVHDVVVPLDSGAWAALMELVLTLCCRQLNFVHRRARNRQKGVLDTSEPTSVLRAVTCGAVALDRDLLHELSSDCYLAALQALQSTDSRPSSSSGVAGIVAMVVKATYGDGQLFARAGGIVKFRSFLEAPYPAVVSMYEMKNDLC
ncbi:hypothetical protein DYB38_011649 [Aphanomyces astaci]|uniref:Uncharacterized protein n=1 Tax=Aphanomyces astaci TaxID=112090 RepID=A0A397BSB2_APHAT|nr:hypothetical protein DYB36_007376 [Aphanomyces astaci]RHY73820.1 hypothetical protein DYB38_011649 [Aphanomyces astaci]